MPVPSNISGRSRCLVATEMCLYSLPPVSSTCWTLQVPPTAMSTQLPSPSWAAPHPVFTISCQLHQCNIIKLQIILPYYQLQRNISIEQPSSMETFLQELSPVPTWNGKGCDNNWVFFWLCWVNLSHDFAHDHAVFMLQRTWWNMSNSVHCHQLKLFYSHRTCLPGSTTADSTSHSVVPISIRVGFWCKAMFELFVTLFNYLLK